MKFPPRPELGTPEYEEWGMEIGRMLWKQAVDKIRLAVSERGLSQSQIARDTGISQPMISRFLKGDDNPMTFERLILLLNYLGFSWAITPSDGGPRQLKPVKAQKPSVKKPQPKKKPRTK